MRKSERSTGLPPVFLLLFFFAAASVGWSQTFTVTTTPEALTLYPGDQNIPLTVSINNSTYTGPISIALTGLPSGISVAPLTLKAGSSGTLLLSASVAAGQNLLPPSLPSPTSASAVVTVVAAAGSTEASSTVTLTVSISNPSFAPAAGDINLPIVRINTSGSPILTATDVPGTITITSADGQTSYLPNGSDSDTTANFHVHGHTTAEMPKLPYDIKLNTSLDLLGTMGLSCPYVTSKGKPTCDKSKSYLLLANYDDKTFLRDWAASALANAIPMGNGYLSSPAGSPTPSGTNTLMPWAPHSLFVELYVNGIYEGNYQLIEKIKVDSNRLNINEMAETDTTGDALTGGYLLEIDQHKDEDYVFQTPQGLPVGLVDPDYSPEVPQQTTYISNYVDAAENALFSANFTDPTLGWRAYFDEASVVNFYIVNDVMGNVDGGDFFSSDYLYKQQDNPLLYMGPIWDFDISSGNVDYFYISDPLTPWMQTRSVWYKQWFTDPKFKADVVTQFNALKNNGVFTTWLASISQEAASLQQSQANNFGRWPMQGLLVWPNAEAAGSYDAEVTYMKTYIQTRIAYLDSLFNNKTPTTTTINASSEEFRAGSPVTLSAQVAGGNSPTGTVTFVSPSFIVGQTATLDASGHASVTVSNLPVGNYNMNAVYNGDSKNALSSSNLIPMDVDLPLAATTTTIASSVASINIGNSVTFTSSVFGTSGIVAPTGTMTFTANGNTLGTAPVTGSGLATFPTTGLASGKQSVETTYSGDKNYQPSSSPTLTVAVVGVPTVTAVSPASGLLGGGANVIIAGTNFTYASAVSFGGVPASSFAIVGASSISAVPPASSGAGMVDITVTTSAGTSAVSAADQFIYLNTPAINFAVTSHTFGDAPFAVVATSNSPGAFTYSVVSGPATISGATVTLTGAGTVVLQASQTASGLYSTGSTQASFIVNPALPPNFALSVTPESMTIKKGTPAIFGLTITPQNGFNQVVSFSCSGLPSGSTCSFAPAMVTPTSAPATSTLTISIMAMARAGNAPGVPPHSREIPWGRFASGIVLALLFWPVRRRRTRLWVVLALVIATGMAISGCGGSGGPQQQAYSVTVTASGEGITQSTAMNLVVKN